MSSGPEEVNFCQQQGGSLGSGYGYSPDSRLHALRLKAGTPAFGIAIFCNPKEGHLVVRIGGTKAA